MSADMTTMAKAEPVSAKKAAAPKVVALVTLKSIFGQIGESHGLVKEQADGLAAGFAEALSNHLVKGDRVRMSGLGHSRGEEPFSSNGTSSSNRWRY